MQMIFAVIDRELTLLPIEHEAPLRDPVAIAADDRAEETIPLCVAGAVVVPEHHVADFPGPIRDVQRYDCSSEVRHLYPEAGNLDGVQLESSAVRKPAERRRRRRRALHAPQVSISDWATQLPRCSDRKRDRERSSVSEPARPSPLYRPHRKPSARAMDCTPPCNSVSPRPSLRRLPSPRRSKPRPHPYRASSRLPPGLGWHQEPCRHYARKLRLFRDAPSASLPSLPSR